MNLGDLEKLIKVGIFECEVLYNDIVIKTINENDYPIEEITFNIKEMKDFEKLVEKIKERMKLKYGMKVLTKIFGE